jgi:hypothetical protein
MPTLFGFSTLSLSSLITLQSHVIQIHKYLISESRPQYKVQLLLACQFPKVSRLVMFNRNSRISKVGLHDNHFYYSISLYCWFQIPIL